MPVRLLLLIAAVTLSMASAPRPVYRVRRSALVPHPAPPAWSGQPMRKGVEFRARNSTVLVPVEPTESPGANAGLFVARHNLGGSFLARAGHNWALGLGVDVGLAADAMQIAEDSAKPPDEGPSHAWRAIFRYSVPFEHGWRVGIGQTIGFLNAPYHETGECIANCEGYAQRYEESGTKTVPVYSTSLLLSHRGGGLTVFGGFTAENHPTNTKNGTYTLGDDDSLDELSPGPWYPLIGGGVEWQMTDDFKVLGQVYQPLSTEIATYGPVLGVSVAAELGSRTPDYGGRIEPEPPVAAAPPGATPPRQPVSPELRRRCALQIGMWRRATSRGDREDGYEELTPECRALLEPAR